MKTIKYILFTLFTILLSTSIVSAESGLTSVEKNESMSVGINEISLNGDNLVLKGYAYQLSHDSTYNENYYTSNGSSHWYELKVNGRTYQDQKGYWVDHTDLNHYDGGGWQQYKM